MKKELLSNNVNLYSLTDFIKMIARLSDEFCMSIVTIGSTSSDARDMSCCLDGNIARVELDYKYYDNEFYITSYLPGRDTEEYEKLKEKIKSEIEK